MGTRYRRSLQPSKHAVGRGCDEDDRSYHELVMVQPGGLPEEATPTGIRVLVVDDDMNLGEVVSRCLAREGYDVELARDRGR